MATNTTGTKRKLDVKTIEEKINAILEVEKGEKSKSQIARELKINTSTLSTWLKNSAHIKEGYLSFSPTRKKLRTGKWDELEDDLMKWFVTVRSQDAVMTGPLVISKAKELASKLGVDDFKGTTGWLERFKDRNGIHFRAMCDESKAEVDNSESMTNWTTRMAAIDEPKAEDDDSEVMTNWTTRLAAISKEYTTGDIYNAAETGLFFKMLPENTMEFTGFQCNDGSLSKDRVTVLVCSNMNGTDKLPLLVIGKSAKPSCFKHVRTLPTAYKHHRRAWMTDNLFEEWLHTVDERMKQQKRKIAMIVDNCAAHPQVRNLTNIELVFLPSYTMTTIQPLEQGVIQNLKVHYRKRVLLHQMRGPAMNTAITMLDALRMLQEAWQCVTPNTIANCFRHAGFTVPCHVTDTCTGATEEDELDDIPLAHFIHVYDVRNFIYFDDELSTSSMGIDDDIVQEILAKRDLQKQTCSTHDEDDEDDDKDSEPPIPPTNDEALSALDIVRSFMESVDNSEKYLESLSSISRRIVRHKFENLVKIKQEIIG